MSYLERMDGQLNKGMLVDEVKRLEGVNKELLGACENALSFAINEGEDCLRDILQQAINKAKGGE